MLIAIAAIASVGGASVVAAQSSAVERDSAAPPSAAMTRPQSRGLTVARFVGGAATALVAHESGHLVSDAAFGAAISFKRVEFGGIPFFAIEHEATVTPRQEFVISSAGFWVQHIGNEWLLTRHPMMRREGGAFVKGMLAFNVLTSVGYAGAAFARTGPLERDTRSIAVAQGLAEPWVGAMILAPALLDTWRYYRPGDAWARWGSRGAKIGMVLLVVR